jgi:serine/threonine protein kinase
MRPASGSGTNATASPSALKTELASTGTETATPVAVTPSPTAAAVVSPSKPESPLHGQIALRRSDGVAHDVSAGSSGPRPSSRSLSPEPQARRDVKQVPARTGDRNSFVHLPRTASDVQRDKSSAEKCMDRSREGLEEANGITVQRTDDERRHHLGHKKEHLLDHLTGFFHFSHTDATDLVNGAAFEPIAKGLIWDDIRNPKLLLRGRTCEVYEGYWKKRHVAVKVAAEGSSAMEGRAKKIMEGEILLLQRIHHPNIISLLGTGERDGLPFIVTEFLSKGSIAPKPRLTRHAGMAEEISMFLRGAYRKLRKMSVDDAVKRTAELADALEYLQKRAIPGATVVHGDLRSDNIGFGENGSAKIMDFSSCQLIPRRPSSASPTVPVKGGDHASRSESPPPELSLPPTSLSLLVSSSLRYMAPECAVGYSPSVSSDIYSLSLVLWGMLSGQEPYQRISRSAFYGRVVIEGERPELDSGWPDEVQSLLRDCWNADAAERPSVKEVKSRLMKISGVSETPPPPRRHTLAGERRRSPMASIVKLFGGSVGASPPSSPAAAACNT